MVIQALHSGLVFNSFSLFSKELEREFGWTNAQLGIAFSLNRLESGMLGPLQGWMTDKWGPRVVLRIGAVLMAFGLLLFSRLDSLFQFYAFYLLVAMGSSLAGFMSITVAIVHWFERKRSRALALTQMGFAFGGPFVFGIGVIINRVGWRQTAFWSSIAVLVIILAAAQLFEKRPADIGQFVDGIDPESDEYDDTPMGTVANPVSEVHFTASEALRTRAFWFISLGHASALLVVGAAMAHLALFLEDELTFSALHTTVIISVLPGMMGVGQLLGGYYGDIASKRYLTSAAMLGHGGGLMLLAFASGPLMVWAFVVVHGLAWGVRGPLQQGMRADYFGATDFGKIMGFSSMITMSGMVLGPVIAGAMADANGSFQPGFIVLASGALIGSLWFFYALPPAPPARDPEPPTNIPPSDRPALTPTTARTP